MRIRQHVNPMLGSRNADPPTSGANNQHFRLLRVIVRDGQIWRDVMKMRMWMGAAVLAATAMGAPALAQSMQSDSMQSNTMQSAPMSSNSMHSNSMMKMSAKDRQKMKSCQAMSHDMMMKDARCAKMMKMHPDMMKSTPKG